MNVHRSSRYMRGRARRSSRSGASARLGPQFRTSAASRMSITIPCPSPRAGDAGGIRRTAVIGYDLRRPEAILADYKLRGALDFSQPRPGADSYWPGRASSWPLTGLAAKRAGVDDILHADIAAWTVPRVAAVARLVPDPPGLLGGLSERTKPWLRELRLAVSI
jgi:hypothetical protein